jgi:hypothetical protein
MQSWSLLNNSNISSGDGSDIDGPDDGGGGDSSDDGDQNQVAELIMTTSE